ncbi:MAG: hypothetical protein ACREE3_15910, partial [Stellaceae bacterium]
MKHRSGGAANGGCEGPGEETAPASAADIGPAEISLSELRQRGSSGMVWAANAAQKRKASSRAGSRLLNPAGCRRHVPLSYPLSYRSSYKGNACSGGIEMPNAYQEDYERIRHAIESATKRLTPDTAILAIMGAVAVTVAGALIHADMGHADAAAKTADSAEFAASGAAAGLVQPLYAFLKGKAKGAPPSVPNPWFVWNGIGDAAASPISREYVKQRRGLLIAGAGVAIASAAASTHTAGVNVGAAVTHANAAGSTLMHIAKLEAIANNYRQSRTIAEWLKVVNGMK